MSNYRQYYKDYYGIDFSDEYEIHHIDFNHKNNEINNLVLLPKKLHRQYHYLLNIINSFKDKSSLTFNVKIQGNRINADNYKIDIIEKFIPVLNMCNKWYDKKYFLDMQKQLKEFNEEENDVSN